MDENRLSELINDAVTDIEPAERLEAIRARTSVRRRRRGWRVSGGAVLAAAAVVAAVALATGGPTTTTDPGPVETSTPTAGSPTPTKRPAESLPEVAVPVYYLGETEAGPRLYREFHRVRADDPLEAAVGRAVSESPLDPDYEMPWPDGVRARASRDGDVITVDLRSGGNDLSEPSPDLSTERADLMIQQLVYTAQAAVGEGRLPVRILLDGEITSQVLGSATGEELTNAPVLQTVSLVNLDAPAEGAEVDGRTLEVTGAANSFEATVVVQLQRVEGSGVLAETFLTATGWEGDRLYPFAGTLVVSGVPPGTYQLTVSTDDPSGGTEGFVFTDTRTVVIS